jgi:hypothetical protein
MVLPLVHWWWWCCCLFLWLPIGDDEATMEIDISGGGWQQQVSAFDSGDG